MAFEGSSFLLSFRSFGVGTAEVPACASSHLTGGAPRRGERSTRLGKGTARPPRSRARRAPVGSCRDSSTSASVAICPGLYTRSRPPAPASSTPLKRRPGNAHGPHRLRPRPRPGNGRRRNDRKRPPSVHAPRPCDAVCAAMSAPRPPQRRRFRACSSRSTSRRSWARPAVRLATRRSSSPRTRIGSPP